LFSDYNDDEHNVDPMLNSFPLMEEENEKRRLANIHGSRRRLKELCIVDRVKGFHFLDFKCICVYNLYDLGFCS